MTHKNNSLSFCIAALQSTCVYLSALMLLIPAPLFAQNPNEAPFSEETYARAMGISTENIASIAAANVKKVADGADHPYGWDLIQHLGEPHPWTAEVYGRDLVESGMDYVQDGLTLLTEDFLDCFDMHLVSPVCAFCQPTAIPRNGCNYKPNNGWVVRYWWPEAEIEVNDFGTAAFNPILGGRLDLLHALLRVQLAQFQADLGYEGPMIGPFGHTERMNLGDGGQTSNLEGHKYNTLLETGAEELRSDGKEGEWVLWYVQTWFGCIPVFYFWINGYVKGNPDAFIDALPRKDKLIYGYTEESYHRPRWTIPVNSALLPPSPQRDPAAMFRAVVPRQGGEALMPYKDDVPLIGGVDAAFGIGGGCMAFRLKNSGQDGRYSDLANIGFAAFDQIMDMENLARVCASDWATYPATGIHLGQYGEFHQGAILTRRAIENLMRDKSNAGRRGHLFADGSESQDAFDKIQRIYPRENPGPTGCFRTSEIDHNNEELFMPGSLHPEHKGSMRYALWNLRQACVCQERGMVDPDDGSNLFAQVARGFFTKHGWGGQAYPCDATDFGCIFAAANGYREPMEDVGEGDFDEDEMTGIPVPALLFAQMLMPIIKLPMYGITGMMNAMTGGMQNAQQSMNSILSRKIDSEDYRSRVAVLDKSVGNLVMNLRKQGVPDDQILTVLQKTGVKLQERRK